MITAARGTNKCDQRRSSPLCNASSRMVLTTARLHVRQASRDAPFRTGDVCHQFGQGTRVNCPARAHDFDGLRAGAYSYLLGLYLGDGCISQHARRVWHLRITLDKKYPAISIAVARPSTRCSRGNMHRSVHVDTDVSTCRTTPSTGPFCYLSMVADRSI